MTRPPCPLGMPSTPPVSNGLDAHDAHWVSQQRQLLLARVGGDGRPCLDILTGEPGWLRVVNDRTLVCHGVAIPAWLLTRALDLLGPAGGVPVAVSVVCGSTQSQLEMQASAHLQVGADGEPTLALQLSVHGPTRRRPGGAAPPPATPASALLQALACLARLRDEETDEHVQRTQHYVTELARQLQGQAGYHLSDAEIELLFHSAPLHDIGKVGIPDAILRKPGALSAAEFDTMKRHPELGWRALNDLERQAGAPLPVLRFAKEIAHSHQEKWDGSGYPQGLRGVAIPLSARLMAVADVYDAVISARVYKPAMSHAQACAVIRAGRGTHFDPVVVDAFEAVADRFDALAQRYRDP